MKRFLASVALCCGVLFFGIVSYAKSEQEPILKEKLERVRYGDIQYRFYIQDLRNKEAESPGTLERLGTNSEELNTLMVFGTKVTAKRWLGYLRAGTEMYPSLIQAMNAERFIGRLTLTDIGTDEKELENLRAKCALYTARLYITYLQEGEDNTFWLMRIHQELKEAKLIIHGLEREDEQVARFEKEEAKRKNK